MYRVITADLKRTAKSHADIDQRTIRRAGRFETFEEACQAAVIMCRANRGKPGAERKRYLVRRHGRCPRRWHGSEEREEPRDGAALLPDLPRA